MITFQEDNFTRGKARWVAKISNGLECIQDDNRECLEKKQAWLRLKDYCQKEKVYIKELILQFRSNKISPLPKDAEGYFFCNKVLKFINDKKLINFFVIGTVHQNLLLTKTFVIPSLQLVSEEVRNLSSSSVEHSWIIWRQQDEFGMTEKGL